MHMAIVARRISLAIRLLTNVSLLWNVVYNHKSCGSKYAAWMARKSFELMGCQSWQRSKICEKSWLIHSMLRWRGSGCSIEANRCVVGGRVKRTRVGEWFLSLVMVMIHQVAIILTVSIIPWHNSPLGNSQLQSQRQRQRDRLRDDWPRMTATNRGKGIACTVVRYK